VVLRRTARGRVRPGAAVNAVRQGGAVGDGGQDRPSRCPWDRPTAPHGWYRPVHRKSVPSQEIRALLGARKQLQIKVIDLKQTVRGLLRGFGLKVGDVSWGKLPARIRELAAGHVMLEQIVEPLLAPPRRCGGSLPSCTARC
jgi:hypothetical protein